MMAASEDNTQTNSDSRWYKRVAWKIGVLWLALRVATGLVALIPSVLKRQTLDDVDEFDPLELTARVWPPSSPISDWVYRISVAPWFRWDAKYYVWSVSRGFSISDGSASFHPLLTLFAKPIHYGGTKPLTALLIVSTVATLLLYFAFYKLALADLSESGSWRATLIFALYPVAYTMYAPYTESSFLLFSVLMFLCLNQKRWGLAAVFGALATLTRQQGLFLLIPFAWELWKAREKRPLSIASGLLIPMAYVLWILYRTFELNDSSPDFSSFQGFVYSILISPSAHKVVAEQEFLFPLHALYLALVKLIAESNVPTLTDLVLGLGFCVLLALAWRNLRSTYRIYCLLLVVISFCYHTGMHVSSPYMGLPRHLLLAFPVFIGLAPRLSEYATSKWVKVEFFLLLLLTFFHCLRVWVP